MFCMVQLNKVFCVYLRKLMPKRGSVCESTPISALPSPGPPLPIKVLTHNELQSLTSAFPQLPYRCIPLHHGRTCVCPSKLKNDWTHTSSNGTQHQGDARKLARTAEDYLPAWQWPGCRWDLSVQFIKEWWRRLWPYRCILYHGRTCVCPSKLKNDCSHTSSNGTQLLEEARKHV